MVTDTQSRHPAGGLLMAIALVFSAPALADPSAPGTADASTARAKPVTLREALELFDRNNHELLEARRAVDAARADVLTARQYPNPTLSLNTTAINPSSARVHGGFWDQSYDTVARLDQPLERGGKRTLRVRAAKALLAASRDDLQDTLRQLRTQAQAAYYDMLLAQERERINADNIGLYGKTLEAAGLRLKAGDISSVDLTRIRVEALKAENDARQAQADREKAQHALAYLIGAETEAPRLRAIDPWPAPQPVPPGVQADAILSQRPDVQAAEARLAAARETRDYARALRTRDVTVGVQYEHYPPDGLNTYGVGFSVPLLLGYAYEGEIARAESQLLAGEEAVDKTRAQARTEIANLRADLDAAATRVRRYQDELLPDSEKAAQAAEFAYRHGARGVMDLIDARRTLRGVQLDAAGARADYAKALAAWNNAVTPYLPNR